MLIDLKELPKGKTYEDSYGAWLDIFRQVACSPIDARLTIRGAPRSWVTLLAYLGGRVIEPQVHFEEDLFLNSVSEDMFSAVEKGRLRELVEMHSTLRPELVDALYKSDVEWPTIERLHQTQKKFNVTNNGSFHRPEVLAYLRWLKTYRATKPRCVVVPCAADKPYPAPLHQRVIQVLESKGVRHLYEVLIASGVLGILPEAAWSDAPEYDAGLPYPWRLFHVASQFFSANDYEKIVVYSDYNHEPLCMAIGHDPSESRRYPLFAAGALKGGERYLDLTDDKYLNMLMEAL